MPYITQTEKIARQEGQTEGQLGRAREDVVDALCVRFGDIPYRLREAIGHVDSLSELKRLLRAAITVASLDEFKV